LLTPWGREGGPSTTQYATALAAVAFGACLALAIPAAAAGESVRIESIGTRLFYQ